MHIFGKENEFQIIFQTVREKFYSTANEEMRNALKEYETYCEIFFFVKSKNLFSMRLDEESAPFNLTTNIFPLVKFFCNNLQYMIIDYPFPVETVARNSVDMMEETKLVEGEDNDVFKYLDIDFDKIDMDLRRKIYRWNLRHGLIGNTGGSLLPYAYFRKCSKSEIEISWDSTYKHNSADGEFYFGHGKGVEYIDIHLFKNTIVDFCTYSLKHLGEFMPTWVDEFQCELQKAIDISVD